MAALAALIAHIESLCARTGTAFPAGDWSTDRLRRRTAPPQEVVRPLLTAIATAWPRCGSDEPKGAAEIVLSAIHLGWGDVAFPAPLASLPALLWLRAAGSLGRRRELLDFLARFTHELARPEHDAVALGGLLRQLRGLRMAKATRVLVDL